MKSLVTGGTSGFGKKMVAHMGDGSLGIGRANDWDLLAKPDHHKVAQKSLDFDVFINFVFLSGDIQLSILQAVYDCWRENKKTGLIVNFGTINTYYKRTSFNEYAIQKSIVDEACRQMSKECLSGKTSFSLTNLRLGYLNMEKNIGKPHYHGQGITAQQICECIIHIYKNRNLTYPEVIMDTNQPYGR